MLRPNPPKRVNTSKIKRVRELRRLTQAYMAMKLGIEQSTYSRIESGDIAPGAERLERIAALLNVTPEDLTSRDPLMLVVDKGGQPTEPSAAAGMVSEAFVKQLTEQLSHVIQEQQLLLKAVQSERGSILELMRSYLERRPSAEEGEERRAAGT